MSFVISGNLLHIRAWGGQQGCLGVVAPGTRGTEGGAGGPWFGEGLQSIPAWGGCWIFKVLCSFRVATWSDKVIKVITGQEGQLSSY